MERRKIILFGKTAFCVTLPQSWVKKNKLQKGDSLNVQETPRNSLELIPAPVLPSKNPGIELDIDGKSIEGIASYLLGAYLNGYSVITLNGPATGKVSSIREYVNDLIATEVMEVTANKIVINMFWDVGSMDLHTLINRIDNILKAMFTETKELLASEASSRGVLEKGHEVKRQVLLTRRVATHALNDSSTAQKFNLSTLELHYFSYLVYFLGRICDFVMELSARIGQAKDAERLGLDLRYAVEKLLFGLFDYYESVMDGYYKQVKGAEFSIERYAGFPEDLSSLREQSSPDAFLLSDSMNLIMAKVHELESVIINMQTSPR